MQPVNGKDFREFAADKLAIWSDLAGHNLIHTEFGTGHITSVQQRSGYIPLIHIVFETGLFTFNSDSFRNGKTSFLVSTSLAQKISGWIIEQPQIEREKIECEVREKEDQIEREFCAEQERIKRERQEILEEAKMKQQKAKIFEQFGWLADKYKVLRENLWADGTISPLGAVLEKLEANEHPDEWMIEWLEKYKLDRLIAMIHYRFYKRTGKMWELVKACKYLRKAHLPERVILLLNEISFDGIYDKKILSALLTTRGGAFRDLNDLESAKISAIYAMDQLPSSPHPHNLMGAILYQGGSPAEGDEHFAKAISLGSKAHEQESTIRQVLSRSVPEARRIVVEYLISKDPTKYAWVLNYAQQV